ncbi:MAG: carboxypeptidase M32, partial [Aeromonadaceae bacterium]|nr:carboxypeptidase M32 [Aeromonadaceae bacterium]
IPELWDLRMSEYLGLSTRNNYRNGCMQDIHWTDGSFGYFPSYTLGAMYAAQFAAALQRELGDFNTLLGSADGLAQVFGWLQQHIWHPASSLGTDALVQAATGESLNAGHFRRHLEQRYLG